MDPRDPLRRLAAGLAVASVVEIMLWGILAEALRQYR